mmetsp:Transcript_33/g.58  ORF Transcript_33/g.58 Transcript_33/m.58 type:complete len:571 (-) Transcript_33:196-1908(-)
MSTGDDGSMVAAECTSKRIPLEVHTGMVDRAVVNDRSSEERSCPTSPFGQDGFHRDRGTPCQHVAVINGLCTTDSCHNIDDSAPGPIISQSYLRVPQRKSFDRTSPTAISINQYKYSPKGFASLAMVSGSEDASLGDLSPSMPLHLKDSSRPISLTPRRFLSRKEKTIRTCRPRSPKVSTSLSFSKEENVTDKGSERTRSDSTMRLMIGPKYNQRPVPHHHVLSAGTLHLPLSSQTTAQQYRVQYDPSASSQDGSDLTSTSRFPPGISTSNKAQRQRAHTFSSAPSTSMDTDLEEGNMRNTTIPSPVRKATLSDSITSIRDEVRSSSFSDVLGAQRNLRTRRWSHGLLTRVAICVCFYVALIVFSNDTSPFAFYSRHWFGIPVSQNRFNSQSKIQGEKLKDVSFGVQHGREIAFPPVKSILTDKSRDSDSGASGDDTPRKDIALATTQAGVSQDQKLVGKKRQPSLAYARTAGGLESQSGVSFGMQKGGVYTPLEMERFVLKDDDIRRSDEEPSLDLDGGLASTVLNVCAWIGFALLVLETASQGVRRRFIFLRQRSVRPQWESSHPRSQ